MTLNQPELSPCSHQVFQNNNGFPLAPTPTPQGRQCLERNSIHQDIGKNLARPCPVRICPCSSTVKAPNHSYLSASRWQCFHKKGCVPSLALSGKKHYFYGRTPPISMASGAAYPSRGSPRARGRYTSLSCQGGHSMQGWGGGHRPSRGTPCLLRPQNNRWPSYKTSLILPAIVFLFC